MSEIGHNNPPSLAELALAEAQYLAERCEGFKVESAEDVTAAALLIDDETKARTSAERTRKDEKQPHLDAGRAVDAAWAPVTDTLQKAIAPVKAAVLAFQKAERARVLAEQERARREAEAAQEAAMRARAEQDTRDPWEVDAAVAKADALAEASQVEAAPVRIAAEGIRARAIRQVWSVEVTDPVALVVALAKNPEVQAAAEKVANARARVEKSALDLPGCKAVATDAI